MVLCHFSPPKSDEKAPLIFAYAKRIGESRGGYEALNGNYLLALHHLPLTNTLYRPPYGG